MAKKMLACLTILSLLIFFIPGLGAEELPVIDTGLDPLLIVETVEVNKVVAGSEFHVSFVVRNIGTGPALNLTIKDLYDDSSIEKHFDILSQPEIKKVESKDVATLNLKMKVSAEAPARDYKVKFNVDYDTVSAAGLQTRTTYTEVKIPVTYGSTKPLFVVKAVQFDPKEPDLNKPFKVNVFFENNSDAHAGNVTVSLDGGTGEKRSFWVLDLTNKKHLFDVKAKQTRVVTFELEAAEKRQSNEVEINFEYDYQAKKESHKETINLPLPRDFDNTGNTEFKPWVIISKYTLSQDKILAGNTVILRMHIENTSDTDIHNAKIAIVDVQLEDNKKGDTVFSPVDSSNTFYIEKIPGRSTIVHEVALYVDPNAQARTYNVPIEIDYEYKRGNSTEQEKANERVNIPVTQESRLEILSLDVPPVAMLGQPVHLSSEFVNVGKVSLSNFIVTMEGDFHKENSTYYVGNFETGMSNYYQAMIIPQQEGELEGTVVFSYIDNNNQEVRVEKPFTLQVEGRPEPVPGMDMGPDGRPMFPDGKGMPMGPGMEAGFMAKVKNNWLAVLLGVILIGQGVFIWRLKRKINQNGEFFDV